MNLMWCILVYNLYICFLYILALLQPSSAKLPATSNLKTVGGMCYVIFRSNRVNIPLQCKVIISNQLQPSLQLKHSNKHQSATANHRPGKPDTLFQHAKAKSDKLSQHARCRQAIPVCIAKVIVYKGLQEPRTVDKQKQWNNCGSQKSLGQEDKQSQHNNIPGSKARHKGWGIRLQQLDRNYKQLED